LEALMHELFDLSGTVAIVTGGTRGIGLGTATVLAELGARVVVSSEDANACAQVEADLRSRGLDVLGTPCNVGQRAQLEHLVQFTLERCGRMDALVCCAGVAPHYGPLSTATDADWDLTLRVNLQSNVWLSSLVIPYLQDRGGSIVFVSSISALRGNKNIGVYAISKAGLAQLARDLAIQWGPQNVRVNAIAPGLIRTEFARLMLEDQALMERRVAITPLRRVGEVRDIAGVIAMLVSPAGAFITGQNLVVDGGTVITDGT
jgi:NAD(P)-dependent dehydrogenase (short-subunit alcohol dehydrogenase family)